MALLHQVDVGNNTPLCLKTRVSLWNLIENFSFQINRRKVRKFDERLNAMQAVTTSVNGAAHPPHQHARHQLVQEMYGGELYEYYPLGKYIVAAPGVCGGRPTFKYTRLEVSMVLAQLSIGRTIEELVRDYARSELTFEAVSEALFLASQTLVKSNSVAQLVMA